MLKIFREIGQILGIVAQKDMYKLGYLAGLDRAYLDMDKFIHKERKKLGVIIEKKKK